MIVNGFLFGLLNSGAGFDQNGDPAPLSKQWSEPIPVNIQTNKRNTEGTYTGGDFTIAQYTILVEGLEFPYRHVMLKTESGKELGKFDVQNAEVLKFVERVKVTV